MQTISSGLLTGNTKRPQDTKEARNMALLLNLEVLACTCNTRYKSCPRLSHGHQLTYSKCYIIESCEVSRFSEQIADAIFTEKKDWAPPLSLHGLLRPIYVLSGAKVRISERNAKEKPDFLFISERKYFRPGGLSTANPSWFIIAWPYLLLTMGKTQIHLDVIALPPRCNHPYTLMHLTAPLNPPGGGRRVDGKSFSIEPAFVQHQTTIRTASECCWTCINFRGLPK